MTLELDQKSNEIIEKEIKSGNYSNPADVIKNALALFEQKKERLEYELKLGLDSGVVENFDFEENLKNLHKKYVKDV